jgi:hypothetical protein
MSAWRAPNAAGGKRMISPVRLGSLAMSDTADMSLIARSAAMQSSPSAAAHRAMQGRGAKSGQFARTAGALSRAMSAMRAAIRARHHAPPLSV